MALGSSLPLLLLLPLPLLLLLTAAGASAGLDVGEKELTLPVACPVHSWCLPAGLCDPGYVLFDVKHPTGEMSLVDQYVCGATDRTPDYVCCDTQELLPHHFKPTPFHWYFQRKGEENTGGLVVAPWPTFSFGDLKDRHNDDRGVHDEQDTLEDLKYSHNDDRGVHEEDTLDQHDEDHDEDSYHSEHNEDFDPGHTSNEETFEDERLRAEIELLEELARLRESQRRIRELEGRMSSEDSQDREARVNGEANLGMMVNGESLANDRRKNRVDQESRTNPTSSAEGEEGSAEPDTALPLPPQICPLRSICVPWNLCEPQQVMYDEETSLQKDYLCGLTEDSELFVCCGRPSFTSDLAVAAQTPAQTPAPTPAPAQLPLNHLAEVFSVFSPPPPPHVTMPPPPASAEALQAAAEHSHYLSDVLLKERQRRALPNTPPQGQVIYPSQIAAQRLKEARTAAAAAGADGGAVEGTAFRSTLGGRLKPAGSLGTVKLGGLAAPPRRPSSEPDASRELPIPPPQPAPALLSPPQPAPAPQSPLDLEEDFPGDSVVSVTRDEASLPERISVTARSVPLSGSVTIRPLRAEMWHGNGPEPPTSRTAAHHSDQSEDSESDDSDLDPDSERRPVSLLSRILEGLPGSPVSSRGHQQGAVRGQFFGGQFFGGPPPLPLHRPSQPPRRGPRPPFHQPPPPPHFQPGQQDPSHLVPNPQAGSHFGQTHQGLPQLLRPPHQTPSHERPAPHHPAPHHPAPHQPAPHQPAPHQPAPHPSTASQHSLHPTAAPQCGRGAATGLHARITTQRGEDGVSGYGEYPWHVGVMTVDLTYLCAGVLVAPRMALTVAHCVTQLPLGSPLLVRVGDWDLASEDELYPAYDVEVVRTVIHPDFYAGNLKNDIALLLLDPPVEGLTHVQPACLPPPHAEFAHQHCWVPGWGQARHVSGDIHDPSSYSWVLREAPVAVVAAGACQHHLRSTHLGPFYQLPRRGVLCAAGRKGSDACFGDGGGALVCPLKEDGHGGPLYAAGLVSWGIGCGQDIPAVYTKVSDYHGWIVSVLEDVEGSAQFQYALGGHARDSARGGQAGNSETT